MILKSSKPIVKRDSTGSIREWWYDVGNEDGRYVWRANAGLQGGKTVTSTWKIVEPKNVGRANATTEEEQAYLEASNAEAAKLREGYFTELKAVDTFHATMPMLAIKFENAKLKYNTNQYYSQPKLDGIRCIARKDGLWTRTGKEIVAVPHVFEELKVFFQKFPDVVLDGELYNHELKDDFNKISSIVRKTKPTKEDLVESQKLAQYHVYDVLHPDYVLFTDRYQWFYDQGFNDKSIRTVPTRVFHSESSRDQLYGEYLEAGYEGQMIRLDAPYEQDKRSKSLIKRKEFLSDEFPVLRVEEGLGNWSGTIKRFVLALPDGTEFGATPRGDLKTLGDLFTSGIKPDWATCRYFTPTPDGIPRFPVVTDWGQGERND